MTSACHVKFLQTLRWKASVPNSQECMWASLWDVDTTDTLWVEQSLSLLPSKQFRKKRAAALFQRLTRTAANQAVFLIWQRTTFLEPCHLTFLEGIIQSPKLPHVLLSSWWELDNILSKTKKAIVFLCGAETARGFVCSPNRGVSSAKELQNNVLYVHLLTDTWRVPPAAHWGLRLKCQNYLPKPKLK